MEGMLFPNRVQIPLNGALWFLPTLFFADIVSFVIIKKFLRSMQFPF